MGITYGDHLIDSGHHDITPEQEREIWAREECSRRGIDPDELCADGGVEAWMVVAREACRPTPVAAAPVVEAVAWELRVFLCGMWGAWLPVARPIDVFREQYAFNLENGTIEVRALVPASVATALQSQVQALQGENERLTKERRILVAEIGGRNAAAALADWRDLKAQVLSLTQQNTHDADHIAKLQYALMFWMPGVSEEIEGELNGRAGDDAYLLAGFMGDFPERCWGNEMIDKVQSLTQELAEAREALKQANEIGALATKFRISEDICVESRGPGSWAVVDGGMVLNASGQWEYEPQPSSRSDEFIANTRFEFAEAYSRARSLQSKGDANG